MKSLKTYLVENKDSKKKPRDFKFLSDAKPGDKFFIAADYAKKSEKIEWCEVEISEIRNDDEYERAFYLKDNSLGIIWIAVENNIEYYDIVYCDAFYKRNKCRAGIIAKTKEELQKSLKDRYSYDIYSITSEINRIQQELDKYTNKLNNLLNRIAID